MCVLFPWSYPVICGPSIDVCHFRVTHRANRVRETAAARRGRVVHLTGLRNFYLLGGPADQPGVNPGPPGDGAEQVGDTAAGNKTGKAAQPQLGKLGGPPGALSPGAPDDGAEQIGDLATGNQTGGKAALRWLIRTTANKDAFYSKVAKANLWIQVTPLAEQGGSKNRPVIAFALVCLLCYLSLHLMLHRQRRYSHLYSVPSQGKEPSTIYSDSLPRQGTIEYQLRSHVGAKDHKISTPIPLLGQKPMNTRFRALARPKPVKNPRARSPYISTLVASQSE
ncbi:hypothetical protein MMC29_005119 [Sticta canariensis]|nr:hypothetical protein [Sticta canariensis]